MAFLDNVRHALGGGTAEELYAKALGQLSEEGVSGYERAGRSFDAAARKADADGNSSLAHRARASIALYAFIQTGQLHHLHQLAEHLPHVDALERPGDVTREVPADALLAEVRGRLWALQVAGGAEDPVEVHRRAAAEFARCMEHRLVTYAYHHASDRHVDVGRSRHLFHTGIAHLLTARGLLESDPDAAARSLGQALAAFAGCDDTEYRERCALELRQIQTRRTCWTCHREFPGEGTYYGAVPADLSPFVVARVAEGGEDTSSVDLERGEVVLCRVCQSTVASMAQHVAEQLVEEMRTALRAEMNARVQELYNALRASR